MDVSIEMFMVYLTFVNKLSWYHPKTTCENIVRKDMNKDNSGSISKNKCQIIPLSFGEEDLVFINWKSCRHCLKNEWSLVKSSNYLFLWPYGNCIQTYLSGLSLKSELFFVQHQFQRLWIYIIYCVRRPCMQ